MSHSLEKTMPTVTTREKDGTVIAEFKSHIVVVHAGAETHTMHLHKDALGHWVVTEPRTGAKVLNVHGTYLGCPVSSKGLTLKDIRGKAHAQLESLIERIGSDKFNTVINGVLSTR
jgi:hypothetical protein